MSPWIIVLIVLVVVIGILVAMYVFGNKMQKKQMAQKEQMMAAAQPVSMLIIDKKYMKMKDAKLPKIVMEQTPKRYQNSKLPIVKAKVGPQILTLIADDAIFDELPTKGEVKAMVSGIYIVQVRSIRGKAVQADDGKGKKTFGAKLRKKQTEYQKMMADDEKAKKAEKEAKAREKAQKAAAKKIMK